MKKQVAVILVILIAAAAVTTLVLHNRRAITPTADVQEEAPADSAYTEQASQTEESSEQMDEDIPGVISLPDDGEDSEEAGTPSVTAETETVETPTVIVDPGTEGPGTESEETEEETGETEETQTPTTAWTAWDAFLALSPREQDEFMKSFDSVEAFTEWMVAAQREWAAAHPAEEIPADGTITIGN